MKTKLNKIKYTLLLFILTIWVYVIPMKLGPIENLGFSFSNQIIGVDKNGTKMNYTWESVSHNKNFPDGSSLKIPIDSIEEVPKKFIEILLNQEDRTFYEDLFGVNYRGLARAILGGAGGGSGICQQAIKNIFFTVQKGSTVVPISNLRRKLVENIMTIHFSQNYTKDAILIAYLNNVHVKSVDGNSIYGLKLSARYHFNKELNDLNIGQMASLVKFFNRTSINTNKESDYFTKTDSEDLRPFEKLYLQNKIGVTQYEEEVLRYRRNSVLKNFFVMKKMSKSQYETEIIRPVNIVDDATFLQSDMGLRNIKGIISKIRKERSLVLPQYDFKKLTGLKIYCTIDVDLQKAAETVYAANKNYSKKDKQSQTSSKENDMLATDYLQYGLLAIDKNSGGITAMLDGRLDIVTNSINYCEVPRQVGSTFKIFDYYTLFEQNPNFNMNTLVQDRKIAKYRSYPSSHSLNKDVTIRQAISYSTNIVPYNLIYENYISLNQVATVASIFNFKINDSITMGTLLGQNEASLTTMVNAYNSVSNEGSLYDNFIIKKITNRNGRTLYERKENNVKQELNKSVCRKLKSCLNGVIQGVNSDEATAYFVADAIKCNKNDINYGGKTGTTDNNADIWFIGYTPKFTMGLWQGYSNGNRKQDYVSGASCANVWTKIIKKYNGK